ncbi:hypothetical protein HK102_008249, partial [Quaeritorhiza haematococci]
SNPSSSHVTGTDDFLRDIISNVHFRTFAPGDTVIKEGDPAKAIFFIVKGVVAVQSDDGEVTFAELSHPAFFGEIGVLHHVNRTATVRAKTKCSMAVLTAEDFRRQLKGYPEIAALIRAEAHDRFTSLSKTLERVGRRVNPETFEKFYEIRKDTSYSSFKEIRTSSSRGSSRKSSEFNIDLTVLDQVAPSERLSLPQPLLQQSLAAAAAASNSNLWGGIGPGRGGGADDDSSIHSQSHDQLAPTSDDQPRSPTASASLLSLSGAGPFGASSTLSSGSSPPTTPLGSNPPAPTDLGFPLTSAPLMAPSIAKHRSLGRRRASVAVWSDEKLSQLVQNIANKEAASASGSSTSSTGPSSGMGAVAAGGTSSHLRSSGLAASAASISSMESASSVGATESTSSLATTSTDGGDGDAVTDQEVDANGDVIKDDSDGENDEKLGGSMEEVDKIGDKEGKTTDDDNDVDFIVPIPLHHALHKKRDSKAKLDVSELGLLGLEKGAKRPDSVLPKLPSKAEETQPNRIHDEGTKKEEDDEKDDGLHGVLGRKVMLKVFGYLDIRTLFALRRLNRSISRSIRGANTVNTVINNNNNNNSSTIKESLLSTIDVSPWHKKIDDAALSAIATYVSSITPNSTSDSNNNLPHLHTLSLKNCWSITDKGLLTLFTHCPFVTHLNLASLWDITDASMLHMVSLVSSASTSPSPASGGVGVGVGDAVIDALNAGVASNLVHLDLSNCRKLTDRAVVAVVSGCARLESLALSYCKNLTDVALAGGGWKKIRKLNLQRCTGIPD